MTERGQRNLLVALTIGVAATRLLALSRSMWDWDEALFSCAVRQFNVAAHHPHPPGFPLFIAVAKFMRWFIRDDFRAVQAVSVLSSFFVFPTLYGFARGLRFPFPTSLSAALIFSFLPNVWYWGGTGFSDIFAVVLFLGSAALLLRDDRRSFYIVGCVLFAATMLVRPQNLLLAYPWALASWRRFRAGRIGDVVIGTTLIVALVLGGYAAAATATGWSDYIGATQGHARYIATVDGSLNPHRAPVLTLFRDFAVDPFLAGATSSVLFFFVIIALLRPRRRDIDVLVTFVPNFLLSWFMLNVGGVSRLSLSYIAMNALLGADGIALVADDVLTWRVSGANRARVHAAAQAVCTALIITLYVIWVWPALREVRQHDAPTAAAAEWLRDSVPAGNGKAYVQGGMTPFADYYLDGWNVVPVRDEIDPEKLPPEPNAFYTAAWDRAATNTINFRRNRERLFGLFHRRYFETCVAPVGTSVQLLDGWYQQESDQHESWRWMGRQSRILVSPLRGRGELDLDLMAPLDVESPPSVVVRFDGEIIDRFAPTTRNFSRKYVVNIIGGAQRIFTMDVDRTVNPARAHLGADRRDLGLKLRSILWKAVK